jgi:YidC/Oxa1 family membrane protein insertase
MVDAIIDILLWIMGLTHFVTRLWALDIVILTVIVRFLMYPLNRSMNRSMKIMQKLQPEMKEIQEKYKDNPEKTQKEIMGLYKRYKINPMSSCLPMLVQMPVFIALFWVLRDPRFYLRLPGFENASFLGISLTIPPLLSHPYPEVALKAGILDLFNLAHFPMLADRFLYLPTLWVVALYIATTLIQSRQMQAQSQSTSSGQPNMMNFMLPMFIIFGMIFPTGLLIYFITSNILQMGQYWRIQREIALEEGLHEEASAKEKGVAVSSNKMIDLRKEGDSRASNRDAPSFGRKKKK